MDIETINRYVGIPYRAGGTDARGCDCLGFALMFVEDQVGVNIPRPHHRTLEQCLAEPFGSFLDRVESPEYGDLAMMPSSNPDFSHHIGVYTPRGILHCHHAHGVILTVHRMALVESYWRPRR